MKFLNVCNHQDEIFFPNGTICIPKYWRKNNSRFL